MRRPIRHGRDVRLGDEVQDFGNREIFQGVKSFLVDPHQVQLVLVWLILRVACGLLDFFDEPVFWHVGTLAAIAVLAGGDEVLEHV